ncbi:Collagen alpha-1(XVII) chain [Durusdinium trenchii]
MTKQLNSYSGHLDHAQSGLAQKAQSQEAAMRELVETRQRQEAFMQQTLGHGDFHPEQYMAQAAQQGYHGYQGYPQGPPAMYGMNPQQMPQDRQERKSGTGPMASVSLAGLALRAMLWLQ